jgi:hypothetical protein
MFTAARGTHGPLLSSSLTAPPLWLGACRLLQLAGPLMVESVTNVGTQLVATTCIARQGGGPLALSALVLAQVRPTAPNPRLVTAMTGTLPARGKHSALLSSPSHCRDGPPAGHDQAAGQCALTARAQVGRVVPNGRGPLTTRRLCQGRPPQGASPAHHQSRGTSSYASLPRDKPPPCNRPSSTSVTASFAV